MTQPQRHGSGQAYAEVIGDPIGHSKSPLIHNFWLGKLGIDAEYRACHVRPDELAGYFAARRKDPDWRGCNVTIPHKVAALQLADFRDDVAISVRATNCVVQNAQRVLVATNTDCDGFNEPIVDVDLDGRDVAVIGAGGAARAVIMVLRGRNVGWVTIHARDQEKAKDLLLQFGQSGAALPIDEPLHENTAMVVNCTPLGMTGYPPLEVDLSRLKSDAVVYDIVYAPLETELLADARKRRLRTIDGLSMLIGQAAVAFEVLFGKVPPREHDAELRELLTR
jgi:shikimate dehydrogenase